MRKPTLRQGSSGPNVRALQEKLNERVRPAPNLKTDGIFGSKTRTAVIDFQTQNWLGADGIVGPITHAALDAPPRDLDVILHPVRPIAQPTQTTCWAASTAMMSSSTVAAVKAKTPSDMWSDAAGLFNSSESDQAVVTGNRYGRHHGLRCNAPMSYPAGTLRTMLIRGPLMFDMLWRPDEYAAGSGSPGHMVVIAGIRSGTSAQDATLLVYDPWPPNRGKISGVDYTTWMREVPTRTYRVFERM
jgi:hypothetical protein